MFRKHEDSELAEAQRSAQLKAIRKDDSSVDDIVVSCSHAALYLLQRGESLHWTKVGIEGFFYVLRRATRPRFRLLLKNQTDSGVGDFVDDLTDSIRYEVKDGTFFYQLGESGDVKGLWFNSRPFMDKFVMTIENVYREIGLSCDGGEGAPPQSQAPSQLFSSPPAVGGVDSGSGKAILQMLNKRVEDSIENSIPTHFQGAGPGGSGGSNQRTMVDLLRKELSGGSSSPASQRPPVVVESHVAPPPPPPGLGVRNGPPPPFPDPFLGPPLQMMHPPHHMQASPLIGQAPQQQQQQGYNNNLSSRPQMVPHHQVGGIPDTVIVSRSDLRLILSDMVGSDEFINELFMRLARRAQR